MKMMKKLFYLYLFVIQFCLAASYVQSQTATLHTVQQNGTRAQCINLVFLSEGYTAADMPKFATHVNNTMNYLFSREPWQQYRSYCNVYRIEIASNQSGTDNGSAGGTRDTYFHSGFVTPSVSQLLTLQGTGSSRVYTLLNAHVPEYDQPIVLVNDTKYGGSGGGVSVASVHSSSAQITEHEIGHSFALLADEYDIEYAGYYPSEEPNTTAQTTRSLIRWNHWIDGSTPVPTPETSAYDNLVGLFEGSMYRTKGWYRPHNNSVMRNLGRPCGHVNREQFVLNYYARVSPINASSPSTAPRDVGKSENLTFSVTPKVPSSGVNLKTAWKIDSTLQAVTTTSFSFNTSILAVGTHTVSAIVSDPTTFVRLDSMGLLDDSRTWTINVIGDVDSIPPSVPTGLSASVVSSSQIDLSWSASTDDVGVTGYKIYRDSTLVGTSTGTTYSDTGLSPSTAYTYQVSARDAAGNESAKSTFASATTLGTIGDSDGDGLLDSWEITHFGSISDSRAISTADPDGDGFSNLSEYTSGTIPVNSSSRLAFINETFPTSTSFEIGWQSVSGKSYEIQTSNDLITWSTVTTIAATSSSTTWTNSGLSGVGKKFYRVRVL